MGLLDYLVDEASIFERSTVVGADRVRRDEVLDVPIEEGRRCRVVRRGDRSIVYDDAGKVRVDTDLMLAPSDVELGDGWVVEVTSGMHAGRYVVEGDPRYGRSVQTTVAGAVYVIVGARRR